MTGRKQRTVKRRIFWSNACMVVLTLLLFLLLNVGIVKIYAEMTEDEIRSSLETRMNENREGGWIVDEEELEDIAKEWTVKKDSFIVLFFVDGVVCVGILAAVSQLFTWNLTRYIMKPLEALEQGAKRVRNQELKEAIRYRGAAEFENVCMTFNDMQRHILEEQEKNQKYEKARTDMIAGISHDLRTPLTAIRGSIKGILDGVVTDAEHRRLFLQTAYKRTEEMDALLGQLFYLSKLETGNMPVSLAKVNLTEFLREYAKGKRSVLPEEGVDLQSEIGEDPVYVMADMEQMQRILDNLVSNSMKYAGVESLVMRLKLTADNGCCHIRFSDNGKGVLPEKLPYLFDEFYRADESRNRQEGNGLGLYIVRQLLELMHGQVSAANETGGFAIDITLPVADV